MRTDDSPRGNGRAGIAGPLGGGLLLAAISFLTLHLAGETDRLISAVWPASGLGVALVYGGGRRYVASVFLGSLTANLLTSMLASPELPWLRALSLATLIAAGAALEAFTAAWFLRRTSGGRSFYQSAAHATRFVLQVAMAASLLSALIGPAGLIAVGWLRPEDWWMAFLTWFVGDATGILVVGAALLVPWNIPIRDPSDGNRLEAALLLIALVLVSAVLTGRYEPAIWEEAPLIYLILPVVLWAVFRFHQQGTAGSLLLVTMMAVAGWAGGHTVFPSNHTGFPLLSLQIFLLMVAAVAWLVCGRVNELRILTQRLEDMVASRLLPEREALRRREENLAVLAHDLQVPLIGIRNLAELLRKSPTGDGDASRRMQVLSEIGEASEYARALAERQLAPGGLDYAPVGVEDVDFVDLVQGAVNRVLLLEPSGPRQVDVRAEPETIRGRADRISLLQVLENLLHNAVKYSPEGGGVTVDVRLEGKTVFIDVTDEGPGFDREERASLFTTSGFRDRIRSRPGSHGLGLFIAGKAMRDMGGTIQCSSLRGEGTTFHIRLPQVVD